MSTEKPSMPLLGDPFPEMEVQTTHGMMNIPGDFKGNWFVLFSHPGDFTPVCTTEFYAFQSRIEQFDKMGVKLVGLSVDQVFSHIKWVEWIRDNLDKEITFPVIAANEEVAHKLGMVHPGKGSNTVRAVFVGDPEGKVRLVLYYPQEIGRNMDEIVRAVKALKVADEEGVAVPADWPNNELIGDRAILPPPKDAREADKRLKENEGYDWWFTHKELENVDQYK